MRQTSQSYGQTRTSSMLTVGGVWQQLCSQHSHSIFVNWYHVSRFSVFSKKFLVASYMFILHLSAAWRPWNIRDRNILFKQQRLWAVTLVNNCIPLLTSNTLLSPAVQWDEVGPTHCWLCMCNAQTTIGCTIKYNLLSIVNKDGQRA